MQEKHDTDIAETSHLAELEKELEEIKKALGIYEMTQEIDMSSDIPKYTFSFGFLPSISRTCDLATVSDSPIEPSSSSLDTNIIVVAPIASLPTAKQPEPNKENTALKRSFSLSSLLSSDSNGSAWKSYKIKMSYNVDVFATDGVNIFYTSYIKDSADLITYCGLDDRRDADRSYIWNQSRILDIVWWGAVSAFVCATNDAIYTITIQNGELKVERKMKKAWSNIRMAINNDRLWLWTKSDTFHGIFVCGNDFKFDLAIDLAHTHIRHFVSNSSSFCLTDKFVASIYKETKKIHKHQLQVHFNDFNLVNFKTVRLGPVHGDIMIRSDGDNHFYILTDGTKIHIVSSNGKRESFNLSNNSNALAVVNSRCVIVSGGRPTIEVLIR